MSAEKIAAANRIDKNCAAMMRSLVRCVDDASDLGLLGDLRLLKTAMQTFHADLTAKYTELTADHSSGAA
jgi:hypothetical protein